MLSIPYSTLNDVFLERMTHPLAKKTYLQYKRVRGESFSSISYTEFGQSVRRVFQAFWNLGLRRGDRIALVSESRPEWLEVDFASLALGAKTVPMFPTLTPQQIEYVVNDSGARCLIVSNDFQLGKALKIADQCPALERILVMNASTALDTSRCPIPILHFTDILDGDPGDIFEEESRKANAHDVITIIYTSGTTGTPKGVMLTHRNLLANMYGALDALPPLDHHDVALSFLPLNHAFERIAMHLFFMLGFTVALAESTETVADNLLEIRPTIMTGVPRFYERVHSRIMRLRDKMPPAKRRLFDWALRVGAEYGARFEGKPMSLGVKLQHPIADALVLKKIRARTGGRIRFFVSGAAALPAEVGRAFAAFGLPIVEGYGMTEASPIISVNPFDRIRWGAVGFALPNVEMSLADDGEILTRGEHVMAGYYKDPAATKEVIDQEGWLHTGDIGAYDADGYMHITDRKKHLFVTSGGKNIAPAPIETLLTHSPYIEQIVLIGDKRQYCTALIVPEFEAFQNLFLSRGETIGSTTDLVDRPDVRQMIELELDRIQKGLATYERVRRFAVLAEPFTIENNLMTPTLKIKRKEVERRYADTIDALYAATTASLTE
jgi:long-chain acyl-CoA synthetase